MSEDGLRRDMPLRWSGTLPATRTGNGPRGARRGDGPPAPPPWATRTVVEEGGVVSHELLSPLHPIVGWCPAAGAPQLVCPSDVSVSVVDRRLGGRWVRSHPEVRLEAGNYSLVDASLLVRAVQELIALAS